MTASNQPAGAMPFRIDRADGIAELVIARFTEHSTTPDERGRLLFVGKQ